MNNSEIYKRLYKDYSKKYINKILISVFFGVLVAVSTSAIAWLLDPAIKKIFVEKDQSLIIIIPSLIIVAFAIKGFALYFAKVIMIRVAEEIKKILQSQMVKSLIKADTQLIDQKHSGKFISNLTYDVNHITNMLSTAILNIFKDSLTLLGLLFVMFYQNWKLSLIAIIMIPVAGIASKTLGKRMGKVVTEAQEKSGFLNTHLIELFKNHKLIKIFQREDYESKRTDGHLNQLKEKNIKIFNLAITPDNILKKKMTFFYSEQDKPNYQIFSNSKKFVKKHFAHGSIKKKNVNCLNISRFLENNKLKKINYIFFVIKIIGGNNFLV